MMASSSKRRKLSTDKFETVGDSNDVQNDSTEQRRSLFVRSLAKTTTTDALIEHFSKSFPLKHATVVLDPTTKESRGFGFVTFTDAEDARAAQSEFNNSTLDGRKIKVEIAESRNREVAGDVAGEKHSVNVKAEELRAKREQEQKDNQPPKLIIRNLPWSIKNADDLSKLFLSYGRVKHAVVPKLSTNKHAQAGFGIVILRGKKNAENALAGLNGKEIDGRVIAVDWAVDKDTWEKVKQEEAQEAKKAEAEAKESEKVKAETKPAKASTKGKADGAEDDASEAAGAELGVVDAAMEDDEDDEDDEGAEDLEDEDLEDEDEEPPATKPLNTENTTVFIRNLPWQSDDESLAAFFKSNFGPVRYARVVYDHDTEQSRGTAFVCFREEEDAKNCVKNAPKPPSAIFAENQKKLKSANVKPSILQNDAEDPSGKYTMEGRILQISRALPKTEADRRANESSKEREKRANDKRRLYLLSEGTIARGSKLYDSLGKAELDIREASAKQRQKLVKSNPNLGLSLTRLSVRNIPRWVDAKALKQLAREAVVGFAADAKEGKRQYVSKEELARAGEADREAEKKRKEQGKGLVKQSKIVYESEMTGGKVGEGKGGRSRGYGFIEYHSHRSALMGLRWLNGHVVKGQGGDGEERSKRLIVEFAIENAQVVQRRDERQKRFDDRRARENAEDGGEQRGAFRRNRDEPRGAMKRKRDDSRSNDRGKTKQPKPSPAKPTNNKKEEKTENQDEKNKIAMRNRIIAQKRQKRKNRR